MATSRNPDFIDGVALRVDDVDRACQAGIEGVRHPEDLQWTLGVRHRGPDEGLLNRPLNSLRVSGRDVPAGGSNDLIVGESPSLNLIPMSQRPTRGLPEADPLGLVGDAVIGQRPRKGILLSGLDIF